MLLFTTYTLIVCIYCELHTVIVFFCNVTYKKKLGSIFDNKSKTPSTHESKFKMAKATIKKGSKDVRSKIPRAAKKPTKKPIKNERSLRCRNSLKLKTVFDNFETFLKTLARRWRISSRNRHIRKVI